jgi:hypothetical protein
MKLDHFKACRFVPIEFKKKLEQLNATNARSTGTTMQYFVQVAKIMGMADGGYGIRFCKEPSDSTVATVSPDVNSATSNTISMVEQESYTGLKAIDDRRRLDRIPSAI